MENPTGFNIILKLINICSFYTAFNETRKKINGQAQIKKTKMVLRR